MMCPASLMEPIQFRVSEKKCDWEIKEEPQPHPKRETVEEGSSQMWKGEQRQHDLDDIGRYRTLVGTVNSTIAVEGLTNQDLADYANSCRKWITFAEIAIARGRGCNRQAPVPVLSETPKALLAAGIPNLPICHTVRHIVRETTISNRAHRHGIEPSLLASVPELLQAPVAIFKAGEGRAAVALDAVDTIGRPLVAYFDLAVPLSVGGGRFRSGELVNFMLSVYGRDSLINEIESARRAGECSVFNEEALLSLAVQALQRRKAA